MSLLARCLVLRVGHYCIYPKLVELSKVSGQLLRVLASWIRVYNSARLDDKCKLTERKKGEQRKRRECVLKKEAEARSNLEATDGGAVAQQAALSLKYQTALSACTPTREQLLQVATTESAKDAIKAITKAHRRLLYKVLEKN